MNSSGNQNQQFALRIERGRTKHPERPISIERFLIGAGSNCHLQLGGEMPILHSIIIQSEAGLWIDSIVKEPQLLVNRQPVRDSQIFSGDIIEIGEFVFSVQELFTESDVQEVGDTATDEENVDLRELTAEDLVDLLAAEMEALESVDERRLAGANSLLEAAANETRLAPDVEENLKTRSLELDEREAFLAEKADHLLRAQERLESYLQKLTAHVGNDSHEDGDKPFRKTA